MTFPLPTDTAHVRIESRQYRLLNLDLGEGVRRSSMKVATLITVPWIALLLLVGAPFADYIWLWVMPPVIATWFAVRRDDSGRVALRSWADALSYRTSGGRHRIINGELATEDDMPAIDAEFAVVQVKS